MRHSSAGIRRFSRVLVAVFGFSSVTVPAVQAGMVSGEHYAASQSIGDQRGRVQTFLERDDVRMQLVALGVDPLQAKQRVAALSDAEIQRLAQLVDQPAGAGVVGAILIIFFVLLLTDLLGLTDVFTFVKKR